MYYEIDSNNKKLRALPGYFAGYKQELSGVDESVLSDVQRDYMGIPDDKIVEVSEDEHLLIKYKEEACGYISYRSGVERKAILDDQTISNILIGASGGYPAYLTTANVAAMIEQFKTIAKTAKSAVDAVEIITDFLTAKAEVDAIIDALSFPSESEILASLAE